MAFNRGNQQRRPSAFFTSPSPKAGTTATPSKKINYDWSNGVVFFTSYMESGVIRVKALSEQFFDDNDPVESAWEVFCETDKIKKYNVGSFFGVPELLVDLDMKTYTAEPFEMAYVCDDNFSFKDSEVPDDLHKKFTELCVKVGLMGIANEPKTAAPPKRKIPTVLDRLKANPQYKMPTIDVDGFYIPENKWWDIVVNMHHNENTLLLGPTGCGKTDVLIRLAKSTGRSIYIKDMSSMFDPQSAMLGTHRLVNGESIFDYSAYAEQVQQENAIIVLDELSRANIGANNLLLPQLDHRRELPIEIADSKHSRSIKVSETLSFFATANIGGEYTGTSELDAALEDRFEIVEMDFMPKDIEAKVLVKRTKVEQRSAEIIAEYAAEIRRLFHENDLSRPISHRSTLRIATKVQRGFDLKDAFESVVVPKYKSETERQSIQAIIQKH